MPHGKTDSSPYKVQVLDRALSILRLLGERSGDRSLAEVCAGLKLHKSTGHRLLTVLEQNRFVEKSPSTGRYRLGLRLFELGSKAIASLDLREQSRPHLNMVLHETEETVHFCIFDQSEVLYIEKMEPQRSVRMSSSIGRRAPAYCTAVGKAILAELPVAEVDAIVHRYGLKSITKNTITTPEALVAELKLIRERGFAIDDEENEEGVRCVGAAVRDYLGRPVAALSVSGPAFRVSKARVLIIAKPVMRAAAALSAELGFKSQASAASGAYSR